MSQVEKVINPTSVMFFRNSLTSLMGVVVAASSFLNVIGLTELGIEIAGIATGLGLLFAKDGNKSSTQLGLK